MSILQKLFSKNKINSQNNSPLSNQNQPNPLVVSPSPDPDNRLAELEKEIIEAQIISSKPNPTPQLNTKWFDKIIWWGIVLGIPIGILAIVNLPYPAIRRPVAKVAPLLLLPSQIGIESNFKESVNLIQQAEQLINNSTSFADIDLGQEKLQEGKKILDQIPLGSEYDWLGYYDRWYYHSSFSWNRFQEMRRQAGELEAKVFQEKNAQTALVSAELQLTQAQTQYQQAKSDSDKKEAIKTWGNAINNLKQIPSTTLAGKNAEQKLSAYQQEFEQVVGLAADNKKVRAFITTARQFSSKAAQKGKNPPHSVVEWQEIEQLWQMAINELQNISTDDLQGYIQAKEFMAEYNNNLAEVRVRLEEEKDSLKALETAQDLIAKLIANLPTEANFSQNNQLMAQIQVIINELDKVQNGTTSYLKAQELKYFAQNKMKELQSSSQ